jgi:hypothetical protein
MAAPMRESKRNGRLWRAARAGLRLGPWLLLSLLLVAVLWQGQPTALAGLFQSPPDDTPTATATSTSEFTPGPAPTGTTVPGITGTAAITSTPGITGTLVVTGTPAILPSSTPLALPSDTPTVGLSETLTVTATPLLPAGAETATPGPTGEEDAGGPGSERYGEGDSDFRVDWGMLFDAVALGLSYVWLCCGGLVVLGVPLFFLVLWVASKRRQRTE